MGGAEVDLVLGAVECEADGAGCLAAVEVVDKQRLYFLGHEKKMIHPVRESPQPGCGYQSPAVMSLAHGRSAGLWYLLAASGSVSSVSVSGSGRPWSRRGFSGRRLRPDSGHEKPAALALRDALFTAQPAWAAGQEMSCPGEWQPPTGLPRAAALPIVASHTEQPGDLRRISCTPAGIAAVFSAFAPALAKGLNLTRRAGSGPEAE